MLNVVVLNELFIFILFYLFGNSSPLKPKTVLLIIKKKNT